MKITIQPNKTSEWYVLVKETQAQVGLYFDEHIENYVILTLDKFMNDNSLITTPIALEFLKTLKITSRASNHRLRKIGDRCLILSGLFPEHIQKTNVSTTYYITIGQQAYLTLADRAHLKLGPELFYKLGLKFVDIKELLNAMRNLYQIRKIH